MAGVSPKWPFNEALNLVSEMLKKRFWRASMVQRAAQSPDFRAFRIDRGRDTTKSLDQLARAVDVGNRSHTTWEFSDNMGDTEFKDWKPSVLNATFNSPWSILRPTVFRFMDKGYVDNFFEDGSLRLSSFTKFSQHDDEERKDTGEGNAVSTLADGEMSLIIASGFGASSYVLCGSISSAETVSDRFGPSALVIEDTLNFAGAVARALPGYKQGIEGLCTYQNRKLIRQKLAGGEIGKMLEKHRLPDGNFNGDIFREVSNHTAIEQMFLKDAKYAHQLEYRLLWECSTMKEHIDISIPEARQFCKRLDR